MQTVETSYSTVMETASCKYPLLRPDDLISQLQRGAVLRLLIVQMVTRGQDHRGACASGSLEGSDYTANMTDRASAMWDCFSVSGTAYNT